MTYYDGTSGPPNSRGQLMIFSSDPTRDRMTNVIAADLRAVRWGVTMPPSHDWQ
ncbi:MAG: hypothetical protein J4F46_05180 [Dehalococcoidia bacterium]|nr:hypothetical protein [Dehalococcoidia bacterium]